MAEVEEILASIQRAREKERQNKAQEEQERLFQIEAYVAEARDARLHSGQW